MTVIEPAAQPQVAPLDTEGFPTWPGKRVAFAVVTIIALFVNFFQLQEGDFPNTYYAAAVKSMSLNWHNFFFVSFDPAGFISVDKPPLGFWLQVLSAKIFGLSTFSVLLPEALSGVLAVILLYYLVERTYGPFAGLIAGLALALTPIVLVTNRNNTIDSILILFLLLGAWAVIRAAETGKLSLLLLCALCVGLGFNTKMAEAFLVVPAFAVLYLLASPHSWKTRILHLLLAGLVMMVISFSWAVAVDLTPASQRPYVGSSSTNSVFNLILGYNGINRIIGFIDIPTAGGGANAPTGSSGASALTFGESGSPGILRLFQEPLGTQIGWLLFLGLASIVVVAWQKRPRLPLDREQQGALLWGFWLLTTFVFFCVSAEFHTYYLSSIAPGLAAMVGIGIVFMWRNYQQTGWRGWALPVTLALSALIQAVILLSYQGLREILIPVILVLSFAAVLALVLFRPRLQQTKPPTSELEEWVLRRRTRLPALSLSTALGALLLAPFLWSAISLAQGSTGMLPHAGLPSPSMGMGMMGGMPGSGSGAPQFPQGGPGGLQPPKGGFPQLPQGASGGGMPGGMSQSNALALFNRVDEKLVKYLEANQGQATFLLGVSNANSASPLILKTGKAVMAWGGFVGNDPVLTVEKLVSYVDSGRIRFFQTAQGMMQLPGGGNNTGLQQWITKNCWVVPTSEWQTPASSSGGFQIPTQLYDCANHH